MYWAVMICYRTVFLKGGSGATGTHMHRQSRPLFHIVPLTDSWKRLRARQTYSRKHVLHSVRNTQWKQTLLQKKKKTPQGATSIRLCFPVFKPVEPEFLMTDMNYPMVPLFAHPARLSPLIATWKKKSCREKSSFSTLLSVSGSTYDPLSHFSYQVDSTWHSVLQGEMGRELVQTISLFVCFFIEMYTDDHIFIMTLTYIFVLKQQE